MPLAYKGEGREKNNQKKKIKKKEKKTSGSPVDGSSLAISRAFTYKLQQQRFPFGNNSLAVSKKA